jgi:hypothetical protein
MNEHLKTQRESYVSQLQNVDQELSNLEQKRTQLATQREQLKGAIFALDTLASSDKQKEEEAPADKPEKKKED